MGENISVITIEYVLNGKVCHGRVIEITNNDSYIVKDNESGDVFEIGRKYTHIVSIEFKEDDKKLDSDYDWLKL